MKIVNSLALVALLVVAGCSGKPKTGELVKTGVDFAKREFERIGKEPIAAASFNSICEMGGTPLSYLTACIKDPEGFPPFAYEKPTSSNSVVVSFDSKDNCFVIEGYYADLTKPAITEKVPYKNVMEKDSTGPKPDKAQLNISLLQACESGETGTVKTATARGADVNIRSNEGGTPLMYACAKGHAEVVKMLIAAGADVKAIAADQNAWPVIMLAAHAGSPEIISMLLEKGADPNVSDQFKNTPLMLASMRGHAQATELLIKGGANIDAQETKRNNSALLHASSRGHTNVVAVLISNGANVNLTDVDGMTALMSCAEKGHAGIAANLIKAKASLETKLTSKVGTGATALMLAAAKGQEEMVRLLLNSGANVKAVDANGSNAQRYATHNNHQAIADILQAAEGGNPPKSSATQTSGTKVTPPASTNTNIINTQSLIGKDQKAADEMFGKQIGKIKKGDTTVIMYKDAEIRLKDNIITEVRK